MSATTETEKRTPAQHAARMQPLAAAALAAIVAVEAAEADAVRDVGGRNCVVFESDENPLRLAAEALDYVPGAAECVLEDAAKTRAAKRPRCEEESE